MKKSVFIYCEKDEADRAAAENLYEHLKPMQGHGLISILSSARDIPPGFEEKAWIKDHIRQANIILLVVTANFCANTDFVFTDLADWTLAQKRAGKSLVVPVIFTKCGWRYSPFGDINPWPDKGAAILGGFPSKEDGLQMVFDALDAVIPEIDQHLAAQAAELRTLKDAIARFNFVEQMQGQYAPGDALFSVVLLKGSEKSGHNLLAWRWRTELAGAPPTAKPLTIALSETQASAEEISREVHRCIAGPAHNDLRAYTPADIVPLLFNRLQTECLAIRFNDYNPLLQQEAIEGFFAGLQQHIEQALQEGKNAPPNRVWFFLLCRNWSPQMEIQLNCPGKTELPAITPVDQPTFEAWHNAHATQISPLAIQRLGLKKEEIITLDPDQNELLEVMERLCAVIFAKTQLYDEYILTLE